MNHLHVATEKTVQHANTLRVVSAKIDAGLISPPATRHAQRLPKCQRGNGGLLIEQMIPEISLTSTKARDVAVAHDRRPLASEEDAGHAASAAQMRPLVIPTDAHEYVARKESADLADTLTIAESAIARIVDFVTLSSRIPGCLVLRFPAGLDDCPEW
jgi:hypothetical protein